MQLVKCARLFREMTITTSILRRFNIVNQGIIIFLHLTLTRRLTRDALVSHAKKSINAEVSLILISAYDTEPIGNLVNYVLTRLQPDTCNNLRH